MGDPEKDLTPQPEASEPQAAEPEATATEAPATEAAPAEPAAEATPEPAAEVPVTEPQMEIAVPVSGGPFYGTGRRKTSIARVYIRPGSGELRVNGVALDKFFTVPAWRKAARGALLFLNVSGQFDAEITVRGGGAAGQAGAVRLGLARALSQANPAIRPKLRQNGFLTRDPRMKERKKYGQKGARKRFQWTKR
ncbi:MAG: 30S ribosomal protein S9 [Candidatus Acidiferrales bacterium]